VPIRRILLAVDFAPPAEIAREHVAHAALRTGAEVVAIHAADPFRRDDVAARLAAWCEPLVTLGITVSPVVEAGHPGEVVPAAADRLRADLVVVGSHGRTGLDRLRLGSVAETVLRAARGNVMVARDRGRGRGGYAHVIVPTDFSAVGEGAVDLAAVLAAPGGVVDLVHFWELPYAATGYWARQTETDELRRAVTRAVDELGDQLLARHRGAHAKLGFRAIEGAPAVALPALVDRVACDLVAMGSHGHRGMRRLWLGSLAESMVRHAPCSVLVARGG